jgi:hypothetical protein
MATGADVFLIAAIPKFAAQAIRKPHENGCKPTRFLSSVLIRVSSVMEVSGLEAGTDIISAAFAKDPMNPAWSAVLILAAGPACIRALALAILSPKSRPARGQRQAGIVAASGCGRWRDPRLVYRNHRSTRILAPTLSFNIAKHLRGTLAVNADQVSMIATLDATCLKPSKRKIAALSPTPPPPVSLFLR